MLEAEKRLTTNQIMRDEDECFDLDEMHVPLALVEGKKPSLVGAETQAEQGSRLYEPEYQEKQWFEHEQFLLDVLKDGKGKRHGKRIAIIGEPGAGKTTLLRKIAFWVWENTEDLPILISLANLPDVDPKQEFLEQYLLGKWLKATLPFISPEMVEVTEALKIELKKLCNQGRVWLLLDGVDEMAVQGEGDRLSAISSQIGGWLGQARVVLTCRLNVWEVNRNVLADNFEIYRTLQFSYGDSTTPDQVGEFIAKWFKREPKLGQELRQALENPDKKRIKDLVKNPLRLALLCSTWRRWREKGGLPDTKAKLYKGYVDKFYEWKDKKCPTTKRQREALNAALGELSKWAIDRPTSRFRLRLSQIPKTLAQTLGYKDEEGSLLWLALKLDWLNHVGVAAENPDEEVYAFFHPTFQEYFAACVIPDWDFFLPRAHDKPMPVSERYRIFEPQWKEVILLWLGQPEEEVPREQKEEFVEALVKFEDGCEGFYNERAYFIALDGIEEFRDCSLKGIIDEVWSHKGVNLHIVELLLWRFEKFQSSMKLYKQSGTSGKLSHMTIGIESLNAINAVLELLDTKHNLLIRGSAIHTTVEITSINPTAINTLISQLQNTENREIHQLISWILGTVSPDNPDVVFQEVAYALTRLLRTSCDELTLAMAAESLHKILRGSIYSIVVTELKNYLATEKVIDAPPGLYQHCYRIVKYYCARNMTYPAFYQAWQSQPTPTNSENQANIAVGSNPSAQSQSKSLNQAELTQSFQNAISNDPRLSLTIHLIYTDSSKFIQYDNPASKIDTLLVKAGCPYQPNQHPPCNPSEPSNPIWLRIPLSGSDVGKNALIYSPPDELRASGIEVVINCLLILAA